MRAGLRFRTASEGETMALAARLGRAVRPPMTFCLSGPLGGGKTTFVRGFLRGAGHRGRVQSPTFALVHEYRRLAPPVYHLDLYRLRESELPRLGLEEYLADASAVCLVEWPAVAAHLLPPDRVEAEFAYESADRAIPRGSAASEVLGAGRTIRLRGRGPRSRRLLSGLRMPARGR